MLKQARYRQVVLKLRSATDFNLLTLYSVPSLFEEIRVVLLEVEKDPLHLLRPIAGELSVYMLRFLPSVARDI